MLFGKSAPKDSFAVERIIRRYWGMCCLAGCVLEAACCVSQRLLSYKESRGTNRNLPWPPASLHQPHPPWLPCCRIIPQESFIPAPAFPPSPTYCCFHSCILSVIHPPPHPSSALSVRFGTREFHMPSAEHGARHVRRTQSIVKNKGLLAAQSMVPGPEA